MARRTKQRSMIDRRKRSSNIKRFAAFFAALVSAAALCFALYFLLNGNIIKKAQQPLLTPEPQKSTSQIIILTTPKSRETPTTEPVFTPEATAEVTKEPITEPTIEVSVEPVE